MGHGSARIDVGHGSARSDVGRALRARFVARASPLWGALSERAATRVQGSPEPARRAGPTWVTAARGLLWGALSERAPARLHRHCGARSPSALRRACIATVGRALRARCDAFAGFTRAGSESRSHMGHGSARVFVGRALRARSGASASPLWGALSERAATRVQGSPEPARRAGPTWVTAARGLTWVTAARGAMWGALSERASTRLHRHCGTRSPSALRRACRAHQSRLGEPAPHGSRQREERWGSRQREERWGPRQREERWGPRQRDEVPRCAARSATGRVMRRVAERGEAVARGDPLRVRCPGGAGAGARHRRVKSPARPTAPSCVENTL